MKFLYCILYLMIVGISVFAIGRIVPKHFFYYDRFPYKCYAWEKDGRIYQKISIQKWKDSFPDMSKVFLNIMPSKRLPREMTTEQIILMIQETCIAEFSHTILMLLSLGCIWIWKGVGGWIVVIIYIIGNLPYNLIQRYNRPKLRNILSRLEIREKGKGEIGA